MLENARSTAFTISELFEEKSEGGWGQEIFSTHPHTYTENPLIHGENRTY